MSNPEFLARLKERGVLLSASGSRLRAVTHYGIETEDIKQALACIEEVLSKVTMGARELEG